MWQARRLLQYETLKGWHLRISTLDPQKLEHREIWYLLSQMYQYKGPLQRMLDVWTTLCLLTRGVLNFFILPWGNIKGGTRACFLDGGCFKPFEISTVCKIRSVPPPMKRMDKSDISWGFDVSNYFRAGGCPAGAKNWSLKDASSEWKSIEPLGV